MADLEVQINTNNLEKAFIKAPVILRKQMADAFDHIARSFYKSLWRDPGIRTRPNVGIGKHSWYTVYDRAKNPGVSIYNYSPVARVQEEGALIADPAGSMAIPIGNALTSRGRLKKRYQAGKEGLFPIKTAGKVYLAEAKTKVVHFLFMLKKSVKLQPRFKFYKTWDSQESRNIQIINQAVDKTIDKIEKE